ncbi:MAG: hypothetical protein LQ351_007555 [Letrouitia transgressa]|nr:MAG: hypothetical protein LQ351_007555 [Letrouitia transgressa]
MQARDSQTLTLPDGRTLGYGDFGDPSGYPLLWFHGFPASRLEALGVSKIARRLNIRLIALDRPGFGLSTFQPGRTIVDWPADVLAFARHANLKRFIVLGSSGGGPYALACAKHLLKEMMSAVVLVACAPPWSAGTQDVPMFARAMAVAAMYVPGPFGFVSTGVTRTGQWLADTSLGARMMGWRLESEEAKRGNTNSARAVQSPQESAESDDEDTQTIAEKRINLIRRTFDPFTQGSKGFIQEALLLFTPDWGFDFEDITFGPIHLYHGTKDYNAPFQMIQYMSDRLQYSTLHSFDDETHFTINNHLEKILTETLVIAKARDANNTE